jgi:hypothetical protein
MKKFRRLGFVAPGREIKVNYSLLSIVLHE